MAIIQGSIGYNAESYLILNGGKVWVNTYVVVVVGLVVVVAVVVVVGVVLVVGLVVVVGLENNLEEEGK